MASPIADGKQVPPKSDPGATITLYWLETSRSQRILWFLEELNIKYELKTYKRNAKTREAPPELKKIHPLGKSPVLGVQTEDASEPRIIAESALIVEYLTDHFGSEFAPKRYPEGKEGRVGAETESWLRYRFYMQYAEASLMGFLLMAFLVSGIRTGSPFFVRPITNAISGRIDSMFLQPNLKTSFGGADIMMSFPLLAAKGRAGLTKEKYPKICAYLDKLESRDAYKRAIQKIVEVEGSYKASL